MRSVDYASACSGINALPATKAAHNRSATATSDQRTISFDNVHDQPLNPRRELIERITCVQNTTKSSARRAPRETSRHNSQPLMISSLNKRVLAILTICS